MSSHRHPVLFSSTAAIVVALGVLAASRLQPTDPTDLVTIPPGAVTYRAAGDFSRDGVAVDPPMVRVAFDRPLVVMRTQVSAAAYRACITAGACDGPDDDADAPAARPDLPAVGLSWRDATAYAAWLSRTSGHDYRLPSDAEWVRLAAEARIEVPIVTAADPADPARRWLAAYEAEAAKAAPIERKPRPFGSFGTNSLGLADVSGNVWEWTDACWTRHVSAASATTREVRNCGVRMVEGRHRGYVSDFVRDARSGGCSVGTPPANLGLRLVRDDRTLFDQIAALID